MFQKLKTIRLDRDKELSAIADIFGDPVSLSACYIEPNCQHHNPADHDEDGPISFVSTSAFKTINNFFNREFSVYGDGRNQMFILSDAGMGKTSLLMILKLTHLLSFWPNKHHCSLLKLGPDSLDHINSIKDKNKTILLLDALDEDPLAWGDIKQRIIEILDATKYFRRVIISCRTQFFPDKGADPFGRPGRVQIKGYVCPMIFLSLFEDDQVEQYLRKRFPRSPKKINNAKQILSEIGSLSLRPLLLSHIEDLLESDQVDWNEYNTFKALIKIWLLREQRKGRGMWRSATITFESLWKCCSTLAFVMQHRETRLLAVNDLEKLINRFPELSELNCIDIGGRSLLNRNSSGDYRFSHYTIQEFLIADSIVHKRRPIRSKDIRLTEKVLSFLTSYSLVKENIDNWPPDEFYLKDIDLRRYSLVEINLRNATVVNCQLQKANLSNVVLDDANCSGSNFSEAVMTNTSVQSTSFVDAILMGVDFSGSDISRANLSGLNLSSSNLSNARITSADLTGVDLSYADLTATKINDTKLSGSDLRYMDLSKSDLVDCKLDSTDLRKAIFVNVTFRNCDMNKSKWIDTQLNGVVFENCQLSGVRANDVKIADSRFHGVDLTCALLQKSSFTNVELNEVCLDQCDLKGSRFSLSKIMGNTFRLTSLKKCIFMECDLNKSDFRQCKLAGCDFEKSDLSNSNFHGVDLCGASFQSSLLYTSDFSNSNVERVYYKEAHLDGCSFKGTKFRLSEFSNATLSSANLDGLDLHNLDFSHMKLTGASLATSDLSNGNFDNCDLRQANLRACKMTNCKLHNANLDKADLERADLTGSKITNATLKGANLSSTSLEKTDLKGSDFTGAKMIKTNLVGALYEENTFNEAITNDIKLSNSCGPEENGQKGCDL
ncbi:pentapeptide repeat-containing protein [Planctomycetota bacterium]